MSLWLLASLFCVFPQPTPLSECNKGSSLGEEHVRQCEARNKSRKKVPPRIRIDKGEWVTFAPKTWRCTAAPFGKSFTFQIENYGRVAWTAKMTFPKTCASGRVDLTVESFYGSVWASCSKRKKTDRDEVVP